MNWIDILFFIILAFFAYKGFRNGFVIMIAVLVGLLVGLYAAIHFSEFTAGYLQGQFQFKPDNVKLLAYIVTFVLTLVLVYLLGYFLTKVLKTAGLGIPNRLAGLILGLVQGLLILSMLVLFIFKIDPNSYLINPNTREKSVLFKPVAKVAPSIYPKLKEYYETVKDTIL